MISLFPQPLTADYISQITGLVGWWEAADAASIAGAAWSPRYGSGMLLGQSTGAQVPTYAATGGYGNTPCLQFNGSASPNCSNLYSCDASRAASAVLLPTSMSVFALICPKSTSAYQWTFEHSTIGGTPTGLLSYWGAASAGQSLSSAHASSNTPILPRNRWLSVGTVANGNPLHYLDGEGFCNPAAFTAIDGSTTATQVFRVGARINGSTQTLIAQFDLMALGIWNRPLNSREMLTLHSILATRIGQTSPIL